MATYKLKYRINIAASVGVYVTGNINDISLESGTPAIVLDVSHRDYKDMLRQATTSVDVYGLLANVLVQTLLHPNPTATENSVDIIITETSECGEYEYPAINITSSNLKYCKSPDGSTCTYSVEGISGDKRITEIRNTLITQQYSSLLGCFFEAGNFTCNMVTLPYINLDTNKVDGNIPALFVRQLIENAVNYISNVQGLPITYNSTTDLFFANPSSVYHNVVQTNFVVGGIDYTSSLSPSAHEGEILLNQPLWTLEQFLDNLCTHYNITWRLVNNSGVYELHIRERNTWNSTPLFDTYTLREYIEEICSGGESEGVYQSIEINQAVASSETSANKPRRYYSEYNTFVTNNSTHQVERLKIEDPFTGCCFNLDGTKEGFEFFRRDTLGDWWYTIITLRPSGGFIVVANDQQENQDNPRLIVPDPAQMANPAYYDAPTGTYHDIIAEYRPYTPAELAYITSIVYSNGIAFSPNARNWHEWVDSEFNTLLSASSDFNRYKFFDLENPVTNQYLGRTAEIQFCFSCSLMVLLGMYEGMTPAIDYKVQVQDTHFGTSSTFAGYIDSIRVDVGKSITVKIRF